MITVESISNTNSFNYLNLYIPKPTGLEVGDVMIAVICTVRALGVTAPSGWTQINSNGDASEGGGYVIFKKEATQDDVNASSFYFYGTYYSIFGSIYRISGADVDNIQIGSPTKTPVTLNNAIILVGVNIHDNSWYVSFSDYSITGGDTVSFTEDRDYHASNGGYMVSLGLASGIYSSLDDITAMNITRSTTAGILYTVMILIPELPSAELDQGFFHFF